jgi:tripartite-type tricarboxylate transporter receptor subunit TctC
MNRFTRRLALEFLAAATLLAPLSALAQYPTQPIKMVVGFTAGGTTDVIGRLISNELQEAFGKPVIVDNRPGASGTIGTGVVAKSRPDGYTLVMVSSTHGTARALYSMLPYDTDKDLVPVSLIATTPYVLVVHPTMQATNFRELISLLKQNPGKFEYASSSPGTSQHLSGEMLQRQMGVSILHVPYKGTGQLMPDLLAGRVPMMFENVAVMTPYIKKGAMRPIAVTSAKRTPLLPDVPTVIESGVPGFEVLGWFGVFAPAGTPPDVIKRLNVEINKIIAKPAVVQRFAELGAEPLGGTPEHLGAFLKAEEDKWGRLIRESGIKLQ